jgi:NADH:ubiquinone oxidoreductase subunit 6 (subunit J)
MSNSVKTNWPIVTALLLMGALPALPAGFIISLLIQGQPHDFVRPVYFERPFPIALHGLAGIIFWLAMPFQFSAKLRMKKPRLHRVMGRMAMISALFLSLSALWILAFNPAVAGWIHRTTMLVTGVGTIFAFSMAMWRVKNRKIPQHRAWVMRAVAIVYGASTTAFVAIPVYLIFGEFPEWMEEANRMIGLLVNLIFVEWWLRRKRAMPRHVPWLTVET